MIFSTAEKLFNSRNVISWTLLEVQEEDVGMWLDYQTIIRQYRALRQEGPQRDHGKYIVNV